MKNIANRRLFLKQSVLGAAALWVSPQLAWAQPAKQAFKIGYSAITWGGKDMDAMRDVSSLGIKGIQLRSNVFRDYVTKLDEVKAALQQANLQMPVFSSGNIGPEPEKRDSYIAQHVAHAEFVSKLGGKFLQITTNRRPDEGPTNDQLKYIGGLLNEIGQRAADKGVRVVYHNHMHQFGETPEEVEVIVSAMDPKHAGFLLDVAHYQQGGGDPAQAVKKYASVLECMHIKDVEAIPDTESRKNNYRFVEIGKGYVNFPAIFDAMKQIGYKSWAIIELDGVPTPNRTPLQCAQNSVEYLKLLKINI